jgi:AcrR family transcriptional regulator
MPASILYEKPASRARRSKLGEPRTQRGRLVAAVGAVAFQDGPGSLTVERICDRAGMSRRTFYDIFINIDDALACAVEDAHEQLWRDIDRQVQTMVAPDWPTAMSTMVVALLAAVERRPAIGWLCVGELATVLPRAQAARHQSMSRLATFIHDGYDGTACEVGASARARAAMGATGALWELVRQQLVDRDSEHPVGELAGPAIFLVLVPYVGRAAAMRLATHPPVLALSGPAPYAAEPPVGRLTELTQQSLLFLRDRPLASNSEVAEGIGVTHASQMSRHLHRLAKERLVVASREGRRNAWSLTEQGAQVVATLGAR